jgi:hypothetical protein
MADRKTTRLWLSMGLITMAVSVVTGEVLVRFLSPTEYYYPRYEFSAEYGLIPGKNAVMVEGVPGKFEFRYTVNAMRHRGELITPGASGLPAVVVLGDSYSFGAGVADGEEYPAVMRRRLEGRADVVNLGIEGWGLTQQIRRYVEVGAGYDPGLVILQFSANDPDDNLQNRVTLVENGEFKFVESKNSLNLLKKFLSRSFVQRSQLYNFFRGRASMYFRDRFVQREQARLEAASPDTTGVPVNEAVYVDLLDPFAEMLRAEGRALWLISVEGHLHRYPFITLAVRELAARGDLRYLEVRDWLPGNTSYGSPEGHQWGTPAHKIIGEHLAAEVASALADTDATSSP